MKKLLAMALAGVLMLGALSGCGGQSGSADSPSSGGNSGTKVVEVDFPTHWVGVSVLSLIHI